MESLTNKEFIEFFESFKYEDEYYTSITTISSPHDTNGNIINDPLIKYDSFKMYSLDEIKHDTKLFNSKYPKSVDAIHFKEREDGKFVLYLIEFKGTNLDTHGLQNLRALNLEIQNRMKECNTRKDSGECFSENMVRDLKTIEKYFLDSIETDVNEKPTEALFLTIPTIYKEYCNKNNKELKDIDEFLRNCEKRLFVFVGRTDKRHANSSRNRLESRGTKIRQHYDKLKNISIINHYEILSKGEFEAFLINEGLIDISQSEDFNRIFKRRYY